MIELAVGPPASEIAGPVEAGARPVGEMIGNKTFGREGRSLVITLRDTGAAYMNFTGDPDGYRLAARVENMDLCIADGHADADLRFVPDNAINGRPDGRFRRTIEIPQFAHAIQHRICEIARQRFAAAKGSEIRISAPAGFDQQSPCCGSGLEQSGAACLQEISQCRPVARHLARHKFDTGADEEREIKLQHGNIEGNRGHGRNDVGRREAGRLPHRP